MFLLPDDYWTVKDTKKKGKGLFAEKDIIAGTVIGDYLGRVIKTADEDTLDDGDNFYLMYYHDQASIYPDIKKPGIHLLNHSCTPNCWMYTYKGHTLFFALRHIFKGEELTVTYLLSPQDKHCSPCTHICNCESVTCFQTMHLSEKKYKKWSAFHEKEAARTKKERVGYKNDLPKLAIYPKNIPDHPIYSLFGTPKREALALKDTKLPSIQKIRELIRESGRALEYPVLHIRILGVIDNRIISEIL